MGQINGRVSERGSVIMVEVRVRVRFKFKGKG
jgi:hypothetical protein